MAEAMKKEEKKIIEQLMCNKSKVLKCLYVMAKQSKKEKKDITGMPCIRGKDGSLKVKNGKAAGPSGVISDLLKVCGIESAKRLANVTNDMLQGYSMPES